MLAIQSHARSALSHGPHARRRWNRAAAPLVESLEGRQLLCLIRWGIPPAEAGAIVRQTSRTLVGQDPTPAQTRALVGVESIRGNYGVTAAIVGSRPFFE